MRWAAALLLASAAFTCGACGSNGDRSTGASSGPAPAPVFGLTEDNADLLWSPVAQAPAAARPFLSARRQLSALDPKYVRLLIDWASLQPDSDSPALLDATVDGCDRDIAPCGAYRGLAAELEALASQQREHPGRFQVVLDIFGVPAWAASAPHGCERAGDSSFARPLLPTAIAAYRALIARLIALGDSRGVALPWWSPWNEPNDPRFITPQRSACGVRAEALAPQVYAQLARAMAAQLDADGAGHKILLGELGGYESGSAHRIGIAEFVDDLPADVLCLSANWSIHVYAGRGQHAYDVDPVSTLEAALDRRGGCASLADVWVTETGAGAPDPGRPRVLGVAEEQAGCLALAAQVLAWRTDPRVRALFQYTFREDPLFPVGLASADLSRLYAVYRMWLAFSGGAPAPMLQAACS